MRKSIRMWMDTPGRIAKKVCSDLYNRLGLITRRSIPGMSFPDPKKKRVLIMVDSLNRAGAQRVACHLASGLADRCDVILLVSRIKDPSYPVSPRVHLICLPKLYYGKKEDFAVRYLKALKKACQIDVSLSMMHRMNVLNLDSRSGERVIVSERNNPMLSIPEKYPECREVYDRADYVVFQTEEVRSMFSPITQAHSCVLPNPVSVTCCAEDVRKLRIVNVARLHKNKNQELLIRAFSEFLPAHPQYTLSFYGEGQEYESLKKLTADLGIESNVVFHGNVSNIHEQISDAGMFVLSSNTEGMPNALLEAMMMGIPCVSTNCTGAKEVIRDHKNGLLTEMGNVAALSDAMAYMADHPEEADRMRREAQVTAQAFRKDKVLEQWERLVLES